MSPAVRRARVNSLAAQAIGKINVDTPVAIRGCSTRSPDWRKCQNSSVLIKGFLTITATEENSTLPSVAPLSSSARTSSSSSAPTAPSRLNPGSALPLRTIAVEVQRNETNNLA